MKKVFKEIVKKIVESVLFVFCKIVYRLEIKGLENIPEGQVIFCGCTNIKSNL